MSNVSQVQEVNIVTASPSSLDIQIFQVHPYRGVRDNPMYSDDRLPGLCEPHAANNAVNTLTWLETQATIDWFYDSSPLSHRYF